MYDFEFKAYNINQNELQVDVNGVAISQFNFVNNTGTFTSKLLKGNNTLTVRATNGEGIISKSESIILKETFLLQIE